MSVMDFSLVAFLFGYFLEKLGFFGWFTKYLHARLPREKSMAVKKLVQGAKRIRLHLACEPGRHAIEVRHIEYLDMVVVITTAENKLVMPYYQIRQVEYEFVEGIEDDADRDSSQT